jgi:hypothetical protein
MPNEIYHRSEWGNPKAEGFGDVYFDAAATNKLYNHSDNYENSDGTDKILRDIPNKASIVLTPTAYSDGSLNTVIPPYAPSYINNIPFVTSEWGSLQEGWSIDEANNKLVAEATWTGINKTATFDGFGDYVGKTVKVSFDAVVTAGSFDIYRPFITSNISESGSYSFTETSVDGRLRFRNRSTDFAGEITNIKFEVIEEADFDFSRGSSATRVNEQGLIEDVASGIPRIDYTSGTGALLLEPQSTNLITYSEDFSNSYWQHNADITVTSSSELAPNGKLNANLIEFDGSGYSFIRTSEGIPSTAATISVFAKKGNWRYLGLRNFQASGNDHTVFDFDTQTFSNIASGQAASFEIFPNGWYKIKVTQPSPEPNPFLGFTISNSTGGELDTTGGQVANVHLFGAQLEEKSYATSYIPTEGSTVTRSADIANNSGNADLFNDSEGVLYAEIASLVGDEDGSFYTDARVLSISNGTANEYIEISLRANKIRFQSVSASGGLVKDVVIDRDGEFDKLAIQYKSNDYKIYINGVSQTITQTTGTPSGLNSLQFEYSGGGLNFYGKVKSLAVFKEALTDEELQALTT